MTTRDNKKTTVNQDELYSCVMTRSIIILSRLCEDLWTIMVAVQAHIFQILRCMKAGSCIQKKPGWNFFNQTKNKIKLMLFKQDSMSTYEMNHPFLGEKQPWLQIYSLWRRSLYIYIHKMWVKAKILVRGVRQMNCNEIPDIWQMAVRRFSRVQSMPSCLYKLYWAHWTK